MLEDLKYETAGSWEELIIWGVDPVLTLLELFDNYIEGEDEDPKLTFFYYEFRHKIERLRNAIYRISKEENEARKQAVLEPA